MLAGFAKEEVSVECIKGTLYAYGSELACLRIFAKYQPSTKARVGYSKNMNTWYFSLEMSF